MRGRRAEERVLLDDHAEPERAELPGHRQGARVPGRPRPRAPRPRPLALAPRRRRQVQQGPALRAAPARRPRRAPPQHPQAPAQGQGPHPRQPAAPQPLHAAQRNQVQLLEPVSQAIARIMPLPIVFGFPLP